ncbi:MAG: Ig domain-containing protein [Lachnospiraceae bacterium]|nr:Ig domain-containing protein [Lachnospiraceae bacterium]
MNWQIKRRFNKKYTMAAVIIAVIAGVVGVGAAVSKADGTVGVKYRAHVAYDGWLKWACDGATAGTTGESKRMEAVKIKLTGDMAGDVVYSTYVKDMGWTGEVKNSETSGVEGQSKQIEAIKIRLEGDVANSYDITYRAHIKNGGWQQWVSNGAVAGSETFGLRIEAIEIKLVEKQIETGIATDYVLNIIGDAEVQQQDAQIQQDAQVQQQQAEQQAQEEAQRQAEEQARLEAERIAQEQAQQQAEQEAQQQQQQVQESPFHKYTDLTETQLKGLARLCQQEQGTARGAAAEASLMANHMDLRHCNARKYDINGTGLYNYVRNGGWFAHAAKWMDKQDPKPEILEAVRKVLVEGKRTLPGYVNEHDCFSDISSATNDGAGISKKDRSAYKQHVTYIKNAYGGNYTFYCFPSDSSDPFGYTSKSKREEIGDFCYNFDDI